MMLPPPCFTVGVVWPGCVIFVLHVGQTVQFWSHLIRAPSSSWLLCVLQGLWKIANRTCDAVDLYSSSRVTMSLLAASLINPLLVQDVSLGDSVGLQLVHPLSMSR
ncbi:hypothetical protein GOODEAATRI_030803 [Goodea atripinnis]|uniref:Secreted protein n=1 Tax=Goodea atripinnis TaxID=208336 RepID=A0ABV0Q2H2_9TELE